MIVRRTRRNENGNTLIEFTLVGIPLVLIFIALIKICIAMWSYHTLAYAVREGARYASTKGQGCTYGGNSCSVTLDTIAHQIATAGTGLIPGQVTLTLTSPAGSVTGLLSSFYGDSTIWPPSSGNVPGSTISVSGSYPAQMNLLMFFPGTGASQISSVTLSASSQQIIQF